MLKIQEATGSNDTFVGRTGEVAAFRRHLAAAKTGQGKFALVAGGPGFGKTSLANVVAREAEAGGFRVLWGRPSESGDSPPYWPWVQIIRSVTRSADAGALGGKLSSIVSGLARLAPEIVHDLGLPPPDQFGIAEGSRFRMFAAVSDFIRHVAGDQGTLVVLEDLHWADGPTLRLLDYLCADIDSAPILILGTYRSDDPGPELGKVLPALRRAAGAEEMRLGPLSRKEVDDFLQRSLVEPDGDLIDAVYERTEGHPLFLMEVARMLSDEQGSNDRSRLPSYIPEGVRSTLARRLDRLGPQCRSMLEAASVLGRSITLGRLESLVPTGNVPELVDEASAASLLLPVPGRPDEFRFEHGLVREALYSQLPIARRLHLHRRAAEALEAEPSPEPFVADLAYHWLQVAGNGDVSRAEHWILQAAAAAEGNLAFESAASLYAAALDLVERRGADPAELASTLVALGRAQWRSGELQACLDSVTRAADLSEEAGRTDLLAQSALVMHGVGDERIVQAVIGLCRRALGSLGQGENELEAALLGRLALAVSESEDVESAMELSARALELSSRVGGFDVLAPALEGRQRALFLPQWSQERLDLGNRMLELALLNNRLDFELWGHAWRAAVMFEHGDAAGITAEIKELKRVADALKDPLSRFHLLKHEAAWAHMTGRFDEARQCWDSAVSLALRIGDASGVGMYLSFVTMLARETGDYESSRRVFDRMGIDPSYQPPVTTTLLALLKLDEGALDEARVDYERLRPLYPVPAYSPGWLMTTSFFGELAAAFNDRDIAASVYSTLLPFDDHFESCGSGVVFCYAPVSYYLGRLAECLEKADEARNHLQDAVEFSQRVGAPGIAARAQCALAKVIRRDDPKESFELATSALATAKVLGMKPLQFGAETLVEQLRPAATATVSLSRRECEVAALVAQGLSNRLIAEALVVSPRTVESHVQSILTKLGFGSRSQVASWATANGLARG